MRGLRLFMKTVLLYLFVYCAMMIIKSGTWNQLEDRSIPEKHGLSPQSPNTNPRFLTEFGDEVWDGRVTQNEVDYFELQRYIQDRSILETIPYRIFQQKPIEFIPWMKNPCFFIPSNSSENAKVGELELKCLPYVFAFGVEKAGSSDIYHRLELHQHLHGAPKKEVHFYNTFPKTAKEFKLIHDGTFGSYMSLYDDPVQQMISDCDNELRLLVDTSHSNIPRTTKKRHCSPHILIDGTPRYFHSVLGVQNEPQNAGLKEPKVMLPHHIKHWLPNAKVIIIVRNPTERMLSAYRYFQYIGRGIINPEHFHQRVLNSTAALNNCTGVTSMKNCLYGYCETGRSCSHNVDNFLNLGIGVYHVYIREIMNAFGRENVFVRRLEDHKLNITASLDELLEFLDLEPFNEESNENLQNLFKEKPIINAAKAEQMEMWSETKKILDDFYRPHNEELAVLMQNSRFAWS